MTNKSIFSKFKLTTKEKVILTYLKIEEKNKIVNPYEFNMLAGIKSKEEKISFKKWVVVLRYLLENDSTAITYFYKILYLHNVLQIKSQNKSITEGMKDAYKGFFLSVAISYSLSLLFKRLINLKTSKLIIAVRPLDEGKLDISKNKTRFYKEYINYQNNISNSVIDVLGDISYKLEKYEYISEALICRYADETIDYLNSYVLPFTKKP
jgi:hypothetical protein